MTPWSQIASAPPLVGAPEGGSDVMIRTREGRPVATGGLLTHFGVTVCSWQRTQGRWGSAGKQWVLAILAIARARQSVTATAVSPADRAGPAARRSDRTRGRRTTHQRSSRPPPRRANAQVTAQIELSAPTR